MRVSQYPNHNPHSFEFLFKQIITMLQDLYIFYFDLFFNLGTFQGQSNKLLFMLYLLSPLSDIYFSNLRYKMFSNIIRESKQ